MRFTKEKILVLMDYHANNILIGQHSTPTHNILDPENKQGKYWHVDHIYSVTDGFLNNVPINVISDISSLRLI
jgi:hypothetical protein